MAAVSFLSETTNFIRKKYAQANFKWPLSGMKSVKDCKGSGIEQQAEILIFFFGHQFFCGFAFILIS